MFARSATIPLRPNRVSDFTLAIEAEIIPVLRRQKGFRDELTLVLPEGLEAVVITLWDHAEDADAYTQAAYPKMLEALEDIVQGPSVVHSFEIANSTWHGIAARVAA